MCSVQCVLEGAWCSTNWVGVYLSFNNKGLAFFFYGSIGIAFNIGAWSVFALWEEMDGLGMAVLVGKFVGEEEGGGGYST